MSDGCRAADPRGGPDAAVVVVLDGGVAATQPPAPGMVDGFHIGAEVQQPARGFRVTARRSPRLDVCR